ncbi:MAG TPA: VTT domain-containing protein, partial [Polyangiaceae bacterium]|nr:VTT domain-containing protein [Polyangiaceae bacterium]
IPSSIVGALLGARLGFGGGFAAGLVGLCLGNAVGYWLGRLVPQRFAVELPQTPSSVALFVSRPVPVLAEAAVLAAGVGRMPFGRVVFATGLGNAIYAALLAGSGAAWLPEDWLGFGLLVPFGLPVLAWLSWRWLRERSSHTGRIEQQP